ncbi:MAG: hypothetical protein RBS78_00865 [Coriobacteriia bacterium]|jgi:hypothetical protein|nr:hypothetical protein [Coriobacteriia bacterium]
MINIQIHGVIRVTWTPPKDRANPNEPKVLVVETLTGTQEITLFLARPERAPEKPAEPSA